MCTWQSSFTAMNMVKGLSIDLAYQDYPSPPPPSSGHVSPYISISVLQHRQTGVWFTDPERIHRECSWLLMFRYAERSCSFLVRLTFITTSSAQDLPRSTRFAVYSDRLQHLWNIKSYEGIQSYLKAGESDIFTIVPIHTSKQVDFAPIGLINMLNTGGAISNLSHTASSTSFKVHGSLAKKGHVSQIWKTLINDMSNISEPRQASFEQRPNPK